MLAPDVRSDGDDDELVSPSEHLANFVSSAIDLEDFVVYAVINPIRLDATISLNDLGSVLGAGDQVNIRKNVLPILVDNRLAFDRNIANERKTGRNHFAECRKRTRLSRVIDQIGTKLCHRISSTHDA